MKKNLLGWFAMATMLVGTGCSSDEVVNDYSPENAIQFGTYVGRDAQGRVTPLTTTNLTSFGVFAYYTDEGGIDNSKLLTKPNFMNNQEVTGSSATGWTYDPVKYWPNEATDKLSFYAYAPYDSKNWTSGYINITIDGDVSNQTDYLYATPRIDMTKQKQTENVLFEFHHALSRIGFKVEAVIDDKNHQNNGAADADNENTGITAGTTISVQEVELLGNFYSEATLSLLDGTFGTKTGAATSYQLLYNVNVGTSDFNNGNAESVQVEKKQLNKDSEYMMLIPKKFEGTDLIRVRVKYTVTTEDTNLDGGKVSVENNIYSEPFAFEFLQGHAYDFVLHLGLQSVKLSADVSGWTEHDVVVNVPINE